MGYEIGVRHVAKRRVPFGHTDPAGIVYYPRFFEWFHDVFEGMFESVLGVSYAELLATTKVGYPAVQAACEWRRPAKFGDLVGVEVFLSRLGERSATFEYRVRRGDELLATASVKVAAMGMDDGRPTRFPASFSSAFAAYVEASDDYPATERIR